MPLKSPSPRRRRSSWLYGFEVELAMALGTIVGSYFLFPMLQTAIQKPVMQKPTAPMVEEPRAKEPPQTKPSAARPSPLVAAMLSPPLRRKGSPLVEQRGTNAFEVPRSYVDQPRLRALLRSRHFDTLNRHLNWLQTAFEDDFMHENWPVQAAASFAIADSSLTPFLDQWVGTTPDHFGALLARGSHHMALASHYRGDKAMTETSLAQREAMRREVQLGFHDLHQALRLRPRLVAADIPLLNGARMMSDERTQSKALAHASNQCPQCFWPVATYLRSLAPQWGGSYDQIAATALLAQTHVADNSRLEVLLGYADFYRADRAMYYDDFETGLVHSDRALALADDGLYHYGRGRALEGLQRPEEALAEFKLAAKQMPFHAMTLGRMGALLGQLGRKQEAINMLRRAVRANPMEARVTGRMQSFLQTELEQASRLFGEDKYVDAIAEAERVLKLHSTYPRALLLRAIAKARLPGSKHFISDLIELTHITPTYFPVFRNLDHAFVRQRKFAEVLPHWKRFIARVPDHAEAYFERAGTYFHLGQYSKSHADLELSCELDYEAACKRLSML